MHSALQSAREALPEVSALISVRDTAGDVVRSLELLYTDAKNALDYDIAKSSEEQAMLGEEAVRSGVRLNILAAIFLPLSTVTGMLGVNLKLGLESAPVWASWSLFGFGLLVGLIVRGWVMRGVPPELVHPREADARRL
jgi:Mg2+ and Co2+ transporter CorA